MSGDIKRRMGSGGGRRVLDRRGPAPRGVLQEERVVGEDVVLHRVSGDQEPPTNIVGLG